MKKERVSDRIRELRKNRLLAAVKAQFGNVADFARAIGRKPASVTHHTNGTRVFEMEDAEVYASVLPKITAEYLMGFDEGEADTIGVDVMGEAAYATWSDPKIISEPSGRSSRLFIPNVLAHKVRFAVLVRDASVNKAIPEGEFAICTPIKDQDLQIGHLIYVEYERVGLVQRTIRIVSPRTKGGFALKTYSSQIQFESSLPYPCDRRDERITIVGRVIGRYGPIDQIQI